MVLKTCTNCSRKKFYKMGRGNWRCAHCRKDFVAPKLPLRMSRKQWRQLLHWFLLEQNTNSLVLHTGLEKGRILRALMYARKAMAKDVPQAFCGTVEVDETYLGGQRKNQRQSERAKKVKRGRGTTKLPVFGILCRNGLVWAEVVDDTTAETLMPLIKRRVLKGSTVCSDTWKGYTGVAANGYVHRLVNHSAGEYSNLKGSHINGLEGFWGFLKRKLASKGGIRRARLPFYLAEYVWRYNHRGENERLKIKRVLSLLKREI